MMGSVIFVLGFIGYGFIAGKLGKLQTLYTSEPNSTVSAYELHTEQVYQNDKYGFRVDLPSSWTRYEVREEKKGEETLIWFGLPLEGDKIEDLVGEPEKSARVIDLEFLDIMPVPYFEANKNNCDEVDGPCAFPLEIARSKKYV